MKIRITYFGEDWGYWTINDYEGYKDAFETDEDFYEYVKEGTFYPDMNGDIDNNFIIGELESIGQSDYCPPKLYEEDIIKIEVKWMK